MKKLIALLLLVCFLLPTIAFAHPGGTDSNGGHYNRSTGEYHYHHGYPAHQHENGVCEYDYHDATEHKSSDSNNSSDSTYFENKPESKTEIESKNENLAEKILKWIALGIVILWFGGSLAFSIGMVLFSFIYNLFINPVKKLLEKKNIFITKKNFKNFLLILFGGIIATFILVAGLSMEQNIFSVEFWKSYATLKELLTVYICFTGSTLPISFFYLFNENGKGSFLGAIFWYLGIFTTSICDYSFVLSNLLCCIIGFGISFLVCWTIYSIVYHKQ